MLYIAPLLAACTPVPMTLERAERICREELSLADGFEGRVALGVGSEGARTKAGVTITNRIFSTQSEEDYFAECVRREMAGEPKPTTFGVTIGDKF